jgi:hypothetical protein
MSLPNRSLPFLPILVFGLPFYPGFFGLVLVVDIQGLVDVIDREVMILELLELLACHRHN